MLLCDGSGVPTLGCPVFQVKKAKRQRRPLKISLEGLSGSGKTFTALRLAFALRRAGVGKRIVVADSENESASLYDGVHIDGEGWEYDVCPIPAEHQTPRGYAAVYDHLAGGGYDLIVIDSLSHAWHGAMDQVDRLAAANRGDKFQAWAKVTPEQRHMMQTLTDGRAHCIATMRVKAEYERIDDGGRAKIRKVGMKTDQREGAEYEFDAVVRLEQAHLATVEKVRGCTAMDGRTGHSPGPDFWKPLIDWWLSAPPLAEQLAAAIRQATSIDALKAAYADSFRAHERGELTADEHAAHTRLKDEQKARIAPAERAEAVAAAVPGVTTASPDAVTAQLVQRFATARTDNERLGVLAHAEKVRADVGEARFAKLLEANDATLDRLQGAAA